MPTKRTKVIYRRSDNGQITTEAYARTHPKTTERQHVSLPPRRLTQIRRRQAGS